MPASHAASPKKHPSPRRRAAPLSLQFAGLTAAPAGWVLQHLISYGFSSYACFPGNTQRINPLPRLDLLRPGLAVAVLAGLLLAAAGGLAALRALRATRGEGEPHGEGLLESGEGRSRFLAACGVFITFLFVAAILSDAVVLFGTPLCRD